MPYDSWIDVIHASYLWIRTKLKYLFLRNAKILKAANIDFLYINRNPEIQNQKKAEHECSALISGVITVLQLGCEECHRRSLSFELNGPCLYTIKLQLDGIANYNCLPL